MIQSQSYDKSIDIWCIGILTFELCVGKTPFVGNGDYRTQK